jgi:hypothetical protein
MTKNRLSALISALREAKNFVENFGELIPLSYLEEKVNLGSSCLTVRQPTKEYLSNIESILYAISKAGRA